jgi:hypothetical protein
MGAARHRPMGPMEGADAMHAMGLMGRDRRRRSAEAATLTVLLLLLAAAPWRSATAADSETPLANAGESAPAGADTEAATSGNRYVAEILDTVYTVNAAEFFALELPTQAEGARADHLSGTITMAEKKGDIIIRIFKSSDYKGWLKKRDLQKSSPIWSSKRARTINVDLDLPLGVPITLLLDNGYSIRTPGCRGNGGKTRWLYRRRFRHATKQRRGGHPAASTAASGRRLEVAVSRWSRRPPAAGPSSPSRASGFSSGA